MIYGLYESPIHPQAPDFWLSEFTRNSAGLPNEPNAAQHANLVRLATEVAQPLRNMVGALNVNSGFRTPEVNASIPGSSDTSEHMEGLAADFGNDWFSGRELAAYLWTRTDLPLGQVIWYTTKGHVHVSYDPNNRRDFRRGDPDGHERSWRPEPGEVDAVLQKVAGGAPDAGTAPRPHPQRPYEGPSHPPQAPRGESGGGGGGVLLLLALIGAGAAAARARGKGRRRRRR